MAETVSSLFTFILSILLALHARQAQLARQRQQGQGGMDRMPQLGSLRTFFLGFLATCFALSIAVWGYAFNIFGQARTTVNTPPVSSKVWKKKHRS